MTPVIDPVDRDPLAVRLGTLPIATPARLLDASALSGLPARSASGHRAHRRRVVRRSLVSTGTVGALVVANGVTAYYAPIYARALADAPALGLVSGPALAAAGLSASAVQPMHDSSTDHGITATLVGAYADGLRTTLIVDVEGVRAGQPGAPSLQHGCRLSDQFGQVYDPTGGEGIDVGPYPIDFQPLRGAAARVGARLTATCDVTDDSGVIGELRLRATLLPGSAASLPVPAAVDHNGSRFAVLSLSRSATALELHTRISGAIIAAGVGHQYAYPGVFLVTPSGRWLIPFATGNNPAQVQRVLRTEHALDETRVFSVSAAGTYRVVVSTDNPGPSARVLAEWTLTLPDFSG